MGIVTNALNVIASNVAGSALPTHIGIGTGSSTWTSGDTSLLAESDRNMINVYDTSVGSQITLVANFSPAELSGTILKEFGVFTTGSEMLNREVLVGSVVFDGENELQIQQTIMFRL